MSRALYRAWLIVVVLLGTLHLNVARADVFQPAYLEIKQISADTYDVLWKVPAIDATTALNVQPKFPTQGLELSSPKKTYATGASIVRWQLHSPQTLEGQTIQFDGLSENRIDVLARYERLDGSAQVERILAVKPIFEIKGNPGPWEVALTYTKIGIEHILLGFDHLLFVLALVLIVHERKMLLWTITSFTLAHSITLALSTLNIIRIPMPPVEAIIALSIVFVALEVIAREKGVDNLAIRKPWIVAFAFGLLHGVGFASALSEVGLPQNSIPLALLFFNVGVEIGQLIFVASVILLAKLVLKLARGKINLRLATMTLAYLIGGTASYWVFERVSRFWS